MPNPARIKFNTGEITVPAIIVSVAEAKMIPRDKFFETAIVGYLYLLKVVQVFVRLMSKLTILIIIIKYMDLYVIRFGML